MLKRVNRLFDTNLKQLNFSDHCRETLQRAGPFEPFSLYIFETYASVLGGKIEINTITKK